MLAPFALYAAGSKWQKLNASKNEPESDNKGLTQEPLLPIFPKAKIPGTRVTAIRVRISITFSVLR